MYSEVNTSLHRKVKPSHLLRNRPFARNNRIDTYYQAP